MKLIKGYTQWLNEEAAAQAPTSGTAGTSGPGAKPEGYTLKSNGVAYKYPFADDAAYTTYSQLGGSGSEADLKTALAKIMPSQKDKPIFSRNADGGLKLEFGHDIVDTAEAALELHQEFAVHEGRRAGLGRVGGELDRGLSAGGEEDGKGEQAKQTGTVHAASGVRGRGAHHGEWNGWNGLQTIGRRSSGHL